MGVESDAAQSFFARSDWKSRPRGIPAELAHGASLINLPLRK